MLVIHKYELEIQDEQIIEVDATFHPLSVQCQRGALVLWVIVSSPVLNIVKRRIVIHGTGNPFENGWAGKHLGTVQMPDGLVWHVFDKGVV